jgi:hypothetical protein
MSNLIMRTGAFCLAVACLGLHQGCTPPEHYYWGGYDASLYSLAKDPSKFQKYGVELQDIIKTGEKNNNVPPGIYAEYGYFLLASGKNTEAVVCFQKEKEKWPSVSLLMDRMITVATSSKPSVKEG